MKQSGELTLKYTFSINQSKEKAFSYLKDIKRRKEFMSMIDNTIITKKMSDANLKGTRFKEVSHFLGFDMNLEYEVVRFVQDKLIAVKCNDGPFYPFMQIELLANAENSCNANVTVRLNLSAARLVPMFIIKPAVEAIVKRSLKKMTDLINSLK